MGQWDKHTSASDTQQAAAQFFAQYINICMVELCSVADENHVLFSQPSVALSVVHPRHSPWAQVQPEPLFALTAGLCSWVACDSHQVILWRWCTAVLLYSLGAEWTGSWPAQPIVVTERTSSGIFPLSFWITFYLGLILVLLMGREN